MAQICSSNFEEPLLRLLVDDGLREAYHLVVFAAVEQTESNGKDDADEDENHGRIVDRGRRHHHVEQHERPNECDRKPPNDWFKAECKEQRGDDGV